MYNKPKIVSRQESLCILCLRTIASVLSSLHLPLVFWASGIWWGNFCFTTISSSLRARGLKIRFNVQNLLGHPVSWKMHLMYFYYLSRKVERDFCLTNSNCLESASWSWLVILEVTTVVSLAAAVGGKALEWSDFIEELRLELPFSSKEDFCSLVVSWDDKGIDWQAWEWVIPKNNYDNGCGIQGVPESLEWEQKIFPIEASNVFSKKMYFCA